MAPRRSHNFGADMHNFSADMAASYPEKVRSRDLGLVRHHRHASRTAAGLIQAVMRLYAADRGSRTLIGETAGCRGLQTGVVADGSGRADHRCGPGGGLRTLNAAAHLINGGKPQARHMEGVQHPFRSASTLRRAVA